MAVSDVLRLAGDVGPVTRVRALLSTTSTILNAIVLDQKIAHGRDMREVCDYLTV